MRCGRGSGRGTGRAEVGSSGRGEELERGVGGRRRAAGGEEGEEEEERTEGCVCTVMRLMNSLSTAMSSFIRDKISARKFS
jgi:hypothetical protein